MTKSKFILCPLMGFFTAISTFAATPANLAVKIESEVVRKIEQTYRSEIKNRTHAEDSEIRVQVSALQLRPSLELVDWKDIQVFGVGLSQAGMQGMFSLPIQVLTKDGRYVSANAFGVIDVIAPVYVAANEIHSNDIIGESQLRRAMMPWKMLNPGFDPLTKEQILGRRSKVRLSAGSAIYSQVLDEPLAVKNGDTVSLTLISGPGVLIRSRAVARSNGKVGDHIKVLNPQTQKQMDVLVTAEKEVEVSL